MKKGIMNKNVLHNKNSYEKGSVISEEKHGADFLLMVQQGHVEPSNMDKIEALEKAADEKEKAKADAEAALAAKNEAAFSEAAAKADGEEESQSKKNGRKK